MTKTIKTIKIKVDNPLMAYAALKLYDIDCKRRGNYIIVSQADFQLANSLLEEWKV